LPGKALRTPRFTTDRQTDPCFKGEHLIETERTGDLSLTAHDSSLSLRIVNSGSSDELVTRHSACIERPELQPGMNINSVRLNPRFDTFDALDAFSAIFR
jgi:hypothetical protein